MMDDGGRKSEVGGKRAKDEGRWTRDERGKRRTKMKG